MMGEHMTRSEFTEAQIVDVLKLAEQDTNMITFADSSASYYQWKSKSGSLVASDLKRLRDIEAEKAKLKKMYAELPLENVAIKAFLGKL